MTPSLALFIFAVIAAATESSSSGISSPLFTRHLRPPEERRTTEAVAFPGVYTAFVPPPVTEDDVSVHFVAQVDLLGVKEISADLIQITFLVRGPEALSLLTRSLYEINDGAGQTNISMQLDPKQTQIFQEQAQSSLLDYENLYSARQQSSYSFIAGYSCYKDVQGSFDWMNAMVTKAGSIPNLSVTLTDIGDSYIKTVTPSSGFDMWAMKITGSSTPTTEGSSKAIMFTMSGIHAREYSPPELLMQWAEQLMDAYDNDADLTAMLDHTEIHLVIQSNPDGRAEAEINKSLYQRKNMNPGTNPSSCGEGNIGVDLNRNFPFRWGYGSGSSSNECAATYRGTAPASEPEVAAIVEYCKKIFPEGQRKVDPKQQQDEAYSEDDTMGIFLDLHSYGELIIWPWAYKELQTANDSQFKALASKLRSFNDYEFSAPLLNYLYPASGVTDDWAYNTLGAAAMTFEIGTSFYESCSNFQSSVLDRNIKALNYAAKISKAPYSLPKGPDVTNLKVTVNEDDTLLIDAAASDAAWSCCSYPASLQAVDEIHFFVDEHPYDTEEVGFLLDTFGSSTIDISSFSSGRHTVYVQATDVDGYNGPVTAIYFEYVATPSQAPTSPPDAPTSPPDAPTSPPDAPTSPPDAPTSPPDEGPYCFSGETTVVVKDKGTTLMKNVLLGDRVLVSGVEDESYQPVYSFGHHIAMPSVEYMQLYPSMLELSPNHMIFVEGKGAVPATMIHVGDQLVGGAVVTDIRKISRRGMYAPFTPSGTIVVNGILASSYVAFQDSPVLMVGPVSTGLSYQWLAHTFQLPHRICCYHLADCNKERYTATGISEWVYQPLNMILWFLNQNLVLKCLLLVPLLVAAGILALVETIIHRPRTMFALVCIIASWFRNAKSI